MPKLRKLIPLLLIAALALVAVPVSAALPTPALYGCTVYENGVLVGAGKNVEAFVGNEATPRGSGVTNADGVAVLEFSVDEEDLGQPLSFTVDGYAADETPDVYVEMGGVLVDLDYYPGVPYYTLGIIINPSGAGFVTKTPDLAQYPAGTVVVLYAEPIGVGMMFAYWSGDASGTNPTTTVTMNANKIVTANFEPLVPPPAETFAWWLYETFVECMVED